MMVVSPLLPSVPSPPWLPLPLVLGMRGSGGGGASIAHRWFSHADEPIGPGPCS